MSADATGAVLVALTEDEGGVTTGVASEYGVGSILVVVAVAAALWYLYRRR